MPRINVEDSIFSDNRFISLCMKLQSIDTALGALVRTWILAQKWYLKTETRNIPLSEWQKQNLPKELFDCGLVVIQDEKWVHVAGADEQFGWLLKCVVSGKTGGILSARNKRKKLQGYPTEPLGEGTGTQASSSSSSSRKNTYMYRRQVDSTDALEEIYSLYPKRDGSQKKKQGMAKLSKLVTSGKLEDVKKAVQNYFSYCQRQDLIGTPKVSMFLTFMNGDWEEWVVPPNGKAHNLSQMSREEKIAKGFILDDTGT